MSSSVVTWQRDLSSLLEKPTEFFSDIKWTVSTVDPSSRAGQDVFCHAHKALVFARAPGSFLNEYVVRPNVVVQTPELFEATLEYIYTARRAETVRFLYSAFALADQSAGEADDVAANTRSKSGKDIVNPSDIEKLRNDLVYMWRSCLFYDLSVHVQDSVFSTHRFILSCRSEYLRTLLRKSQADAFITLPSPPFTPASTHFLLGFLYSGTLDFSQRSFDLATAFSVYDSAGHVKLPELQLQVQEKITSMCDDFTKPHSRTPRVFKWAIGRSATLEQKARKVIVENFDTLWPQLLSSQLTKAEANTILSSLLASLRFATLVPLLRQLMVAQACPKDPILSPVLSDLEKGISNLLKTNLLDVINSRSCELFLTMSPNEQSQESEAANLPTLERLLVLIREGISDMNAVRTYQVIVGNLLIRETPLPKHYRNAIEDAKKGILAYISQRWEDIRASNGFSDAEYWVVSEIGSEIDQDPNILLLLPRSELPQYNSEQSVEKMEYAESFKSEKTRKSSLSAVTVRKAPVKVTTHDSMSIKSLNKKMGAIPKLPNTAVPKVAASVSRVAEARMKAAAQSRANASSRSTANRSKISSPSSTNKQPVEQTPKQKPIINLPSSEKTLRSARSFTEPSRKIAIDQSLVRSRNLSSNFRTTDASKSEKTDKIDVASSYSSNFVRRSVHSTSQSGHILNIKSRDGDSTKSSQPMQVNDLSLGRSILNTANKDIVHGQVPKNSTSNQQLDLTNKEISRNPNVPSEISHNQTTQQDVPPLKGSNLECGIPVIVSCHSLKGEPTRRSFKAHLRYLGELFGEVGPWVGVEVHYAEHREEGYSWCDGTLHGVRYFFPFSGETARDAKKRKITSISNSLTEAGSQTKTISRSSNNVKDENFGYSRRCLFVRPTSIVWVVSPEELGSFI